MDVSEEFVASIPSYSEKIKTASTSEASVTSHKWTWCWIPAEFGLNYQGHANLKNAYQNCNACITKDLFMNL